MSRVARNFCSLLAAAAVLLVSVTCTSAGCVLQGESATYKPVVAKAACCSHSDAAKQEHQRSDREGDRCPLCHGPVFAAKSVKSTSGNDMSAAHLFVCPVFS